MRPFSRSEMETMPTTLPGSSRLNTGSLVKPGDLLVQVDTRDVRNQYNQADADVKAEPQQALNTKTQRHETRPPTGARHVRRHFESAARQAASRSVTDAVDPQRINVFERWQSLDALKGFRGPGPDAQTRRRILSAHITEYEVR